VDCQRRGAIMIRVPPRVNDEAALVVGQFDQGDVRCAGSLPGSRRKLSPKATPDQWVWGYAFIDDASFLVIRNRNPANTNGAARRPRLISPEGE
jgi:hypothetical protein